jgi:hypothetical protein
MKFDTLKQFGMKVTTIFERHLKHGIFDLFLDRCSYCWLPNGRHQRIIGHAEASVALDYSDVNDEFEMEIAVLPFSLWSSSMLLVYQGLIDDKLYAINPFCLWG